MPSPDETIRSVAEHGLGRCPAAVIDCLLKVCARDESGDELALILESDPALTARVLRHAAGASHAGGAPVGDVGRAIALLGTRAAKIAALSGLEPDEAAGGAIAVEVARLRSRALIRAAVARAAAHAADFGRADLAGTAGLLLEIARLAVLNAGDGGAARLASALALGNRGEAARALEASAFGAGGGALSAALLRAWALPDEITLAVEIGGGDPSHDPPGGDDWSLARAVRLADEAAWAMPEGRFEAPVVEAFAPRAAALMGIREQTWIDAAAEIAADIELHARAPGGEAAAPCEAAVSPRRVAGMLAALALKSEAENREMRARQGDLMRRVTTDQLTGVKNRAAFDERLEEEIARSARTGDSLMLFLADIDDFKQINDRHGHLAGDLILKAAAEAIERSARKFDFVARYGGEEFAIIAPQCGLPGAESIAERIRQAVESTSVTFGGQKIRTTVSLGGAIAEWPSRPRTATALLAAADARLYEAKRAGKNCWRLEIPGTSWAAAS